MKNKNKKYVKPVTLNPMTSVEVKKNKKLVRPVTLNPMTAN